MPVFAITFDENRRSSFGKTVAVMELLVAAFSAVIIGGGLYLKLSLEAYAWLLEGYKTGPLPNMLLSIGSMGMIINGCGSKICYDCSRYEKRFRFENLLKLHIISIFLLGWIILAGAVMCEYHDSVLKTEFHDGFVSAIGSYKESWKVKKTMDSLQMNFRCCGSKNYTDWFSRSWIQSKYFAKVPKGNAAAPKKSDHRFKAIRFVEGEGLINGVPFSCCREDASVPCHHYNLRHDDGALNSVNGAHASGVRASGAPDSDAENDQPDDASMIHGRGCNEQIVTKFEIVLEVFAKMLWAMAIAELNLLIMVRYLQTAIDNSYVYGDPLGENPAWLFERCPCACLDEHQPVDKIGPSRRKEMELEMET